MHTLLTNQQQKKQWKMYVNCVSKRSSEIIDWGLQLIISGIFFYIFGSFQRVFRAPFSQGSAEAHTGWRGNLNDRLMASCV